MPGSSRTLRHRSLALLAALATALSLALVGAGVQAGTAAGPPRPVTIVLDQVSSAVSAPTGTPGGAVPYVIVEAGQNFFVDVSFLDAQGQPASFNTDTTLSIETNTGAANEPTPATGVAPRGATSVRLTTSLPRPANQVEITVDAPDAKGPNDVTPGVSSADQLFDVLEDVRFHDSAPGTPFTEGIGGLADCTEATRDNPVCGVVILPNGAQSSQVLLSLGACDAEYGGCSSTRGKVVQALADLAGLYTDTSPASLLLKCDKSLCGRGPLQETVPHYSLLGNAALQPTPPCPARGTLGADQEVCTDYVESQRDNSGDSLLYVLFKKDARVSVR